MTGYPLPTLDLRLAMLVSLLSGCVSPLAALTSRTEVVHGTTRFELRSVPSSHDDVERVKASLERAGAGLSTWGGLREPVTVNVLPGHDELTEVVGRRYDWLRAWAQYGEVELQAPSSWPAHVDRLDQLVLHELTHCALFQRVATRGDWTRRQTPLWFREGMALWTAQQGPTLPSLEDSARWLVANPEADVFGDAEALTRAQADEVYGVAFHAFSFLVQRSGVARVQALLDAMGAGASFEAAFSQSYGVPASTFTRDARHWLAWRGFRGTGRAVHQSAAVPR